MTRPVPARTYPVREVVVAAAPSDPAVPVDILFRYMGSLVKVRETTAAGQAWLDALRQRRPGLWNSFAGEALTMTLGAYQVLTWPVRREGLTIDLEGTYGTSQPGDLRKWR